MTNSLDFIFMRPGPQPKQKLKRSNPSIIRDVQATRERHSQTLPQQLQVAILGG